MQRRSRDRNVRAFEFMIRNEKKIRDAVEEARANKGSHTGGTPTGHAFISDPTAGEAIRNVEELSVVEIEGGGRVEWPERWLRVIDAVRAWCEPFYLRREILRRRYTAKAGQKPARRLKYHATGISAKQGIEKSSVPFAPMRCNAPRRLVSSRYFRQNEKPSRRTAFARREFGENSTGLTLGRLIP